MRMVNLIEKKKDGGELSREEIIYIVNGYTSGSIPDYQMAAFLMAVVLRDMSERETTDLTMAMLRSGEVVDLSDVPGVKIDKHSTGGVGDTTTLVVAPLVAACGGHVAKMSGRGLGHTGGTLDKLESIPGLSVEQPLERFKQIVRSVGISVIGQSIDLVPADKKMYALRDATGTVQSIPLIAASIMSKKLAAGADAIVLDVKTGSGAFCETLDMAERLARLMVGLGRRLDRRVTAVVTDMNQPLGMAVGNALEFREAVQLLSGQIPNTDPLYEVCMLLGAHMLLLSGLCRSQDEAHERLSVALGSGAGLSKLVQMVEAQGGDGRYVDAGRIESLCRVKRLVRLYADAAGYLCTVDTERIGKAAQLLGAGRATKEDSIDPAVGLLMHKRIGDPISENEPVCTLYVNDETHVSEAEQLVRDALHVRSERPDSNPIVYRVITDAERD